jgi:hypothetical protein
MTTKDAIPTGVIAASLVFYVAICFAVADERRPDKPAGSLPAAVQTWIKTPARGAVVDGFKPGLL